MNRRRASTLARSPLLIALALLAGLAATDTAEAQRLRPNAVRLSPTDHARLDRLADTFTRTIQQSFTPVVDLHIAEVSMDAGVRFVKAVDGRTASAPTRFELTGVAPGSRVAMVLTAGASGHVMQPTYGGRPLSVVERYGQSDTVHLTHRRPGASRSEPVLAVPSRGLVTQEGFEVALEPGAHSFFYFRRGAVGDGTTEGSEPELRQVDVVVK